MLPPLLSFVLFDVGNSVDTVGFFSPLCASRLPSVAAKCAKARLFQNAARGCASGSFAVPPPVTPANWHVRTHQRHPTTTPHHQLPNDVVVDAIANVAVVIMSLLLTMPSVTHLHRVPHYTQRIVLALKPDPLEGIRLHSTDTAIVPIPSFLLPTGLLFQRRLFAQRIVLGLFRLQLGRERLRSIDTAVLVAAADVNETLCRRSFLILFSPCGHC